MKWSWTSPDVAKSGARFPAGSDHGAIATAGRIRRKTIASNHRAGASYWSRAVLTGQRVVEHHLGTSPAVGWTADITPQVIRVDDGGRAIIENQVKIPVVIFMLKRSAMVSPPR